MAEAPVLLEIRRLKKYFPVKGVRGPGIRAVEDVSLQIRQGETLGLVGESGCGKTTLGRAILQLYPPTSGEILYRGVPLFRGQDPFRQNSRGETVRVRTPKPWRADMLPYRRKMQIIFQDPGGSLDPRMTAEEIIGQALDIHGLYPRRGERAERIGALMARVGLDPRQGDRYPHQFSGGQQQRIGIARALAVEPEFLVCDEPISALDVSIQAQVVNLLEDMQQELGLAYLFIAHDLGVVRHISHRVGVMYLGRLVELGESAALYGAPLHPYTRTLLAAIPLPDPAAARARRRTAPEGDPPSPLDPPPGCPFHPRCPRAEARCRREAPELREYAPGHWAACHLPG